VSSCTSGRPAGRRSSSRSRTIRRGTLPEACDLVEETLLVDDGADELAAAYRAARETADRLERGEDVDPGDIGAAVENLRSIRAALSNEASAED
jgi:hypothetical protein